MAKKTTYSFPECWEDDIRMNALFAPFRVKSINVEYYENKLDFWQKLIYDVCKFKVGSSVFSKCELECIFKRKEETPHCLDTVIEEMENRGLVQEQSEFYSRSTHSWSSWILYKLIKIPWNWSYKKIISKSSPDTCQFIYCDILKQQTNELLLILRKHSGKVFTYNDLKKEIENDIFFNDVGLKVCLFSLNIQKIISLDCEAKGNDFNIKLIKIPSETNPFDKLTDIDRNFQQLKNTQKYLTEDMKDTELKIVKYDNLARKHIKDNRKLAANYLRKKQHFQKRLERKAEFLLSIEALIANIEDAQDNGIIVSAFKIGSETLQTLNSKINMNYIDEICSKMEEVLNNHGEIADCMDNFNRADVDEIDLDKELAELCLSEMASESKILPTKQITNCPNNQLDDDIFKPLNNSLVEPYMPSSKNTAITE